MDNVELSARITALEDQRNAALTEVVFLKGKLAVMEEVNKTLIANGERLVAEINALKAASNDNATAS